MVTVDLETWGTLLGVLVSAVALGSLMLNGQRKLEARIDALDSKFEEKIDDRFGTLDTKIDDKFSTLDTKIDAKIDGLRKELKDEIRDLAVVVQRIDQRVYDLATGRASTLIVPPH